MQGASRSTSCHLAVVTGLSILAGVVGGVADYFHPADLSALPISQSDPLVHSGIVASVVAGGAFLVLGACTIALQKHISQCCYSDGAQERLLPQGANAARWSGSAARAFVRGKNVGSSPRSVPLARPLTGQEGARAPSPTTPILDDLLRAQGLSPIVIASGGDSDAGGQKKYSFRPGQRRGRDDSYSTPGSNL